jgi:RimJ/RimL family protein N-acetyltransferase
VAHLFNDHGVGIVRGVTDTRNGRSAALLDRLGFRCVAHHRNADYFKGSPSHEYVFEVRREAWAAAGPGVARGDDRPGTVRTPRLLLRCWEPGDAALLKEAIDSSLTELRQWMPWAASEPSPLASIAERIDKFRRAFDAGHDWTYGVFDRDASRVLGGAGLHPRIEPGWLEIGYWIRSSEVGHGLATEAAAALAEAAFRVHDAGGVEIRCDPRNTRSAAIPRRLGFEHVLTLQGEATATNGEPRDTMVWMRRRPGSPA